MDQDGVGALGQASNRLAHHGARDLTPNCEDIQLPRRLRSHQWHPPRPDAGVQVGTRPPPMQRPRGHRSRLSVAPPSLIVPRLPGELATSAAADVHWAPLAAWSETIDLKVKAGQLVEWTGGVGDQLTARGMRLRQLCWVGRGPRGMVSSLSINDPPTAQRVRGVGPGNPFSDTPSELGCRSCGPGHAPQP